MKNEQAKQKLTTSQIFQSTKHFQIFTGGRNRDRRGGHHQAERDAAEGGDRGGGAGAGAVRHLHIREHKVGQGGVHHGGGEGGCEDGQRAQLHRGNAPC